MPGPLPNPQRRRRNAPTIPTTVLPAEGREGSPPRCPIKLGKAGRAWWRWAWSTPQAAAWTPGNLYALAHRASLEDDLVALEVEPLNLIDLVEDDKLGQTLRAVIVRLQSLAVGRLKVLQEMRESDKQFGLTAKGMADLRWSIAAADEKGEQKDDAPAAAPPVRRLRAVDPALVAEHAG